MSRSICFLRILVGTVLLAEIGSIALAKDATSTGGQSASTGAQLEQIIVTAQLDRLSSNVQPCAQVHFSTSRMGTLHTTPDTPH
jgi:hypothetical protein